MGSGRFPWVRAPVLPTRTQNPFRPVRTSPVSWGPFREEGRLWPHSGSPRKVHDSHRQKQLFILNRSLDAGVKFRGNFGRQLCRNKTWQSWRFIPLDCSRLFCAKQPSFPLFFLAGFALWASALNLFQVPCSLLGLRSGMRAWWNACSYLQITILWCC